MCWALVDPGLFSSLHFRLTRLAVTGTGGPCAEDAIHHRYKPLQLKHLASVVSSVIVWRWPGAAPLKCYVFSLPGAALCLRSMTSVGSYVRATATRRWCLYSNNIRELSKGFPGGCSQPARTAAKLQRHHDDPVPVVSHGLTLTQCFSARECSHVLVDFAIV